MTRSTGSSILPAALVAGIGLAGCAAQTDYSNVSTSPVTMACDGGRTFTVSYANGFETAVIETEGRRLELQRVRTTLGMNPTPGLLGDPSSPQFEATSPGVETGGGGPSVTTAGTTGVPSCARMRTGRCVVKTTTERSPRRRAKATTCPASVPSTSSGA